MELEMTFHSVGNVIIPTDEVIFFRGVGEKPPTSIIRGMKSPCNHREIFTSQVYLENWFAHVHRPGPSESARERRLEARPLFRAAGSREVPNGGFPKWGYPQSSSIYRWIFHEINHPAIGGTHIYGTPQMSQSPVSNVKSPYRMVYGRYNELVTFW